MGQKISKTKKVKFQESVPKSLVPLTKRKSKLTRRHLVIDDLILNGNIIKGYLSKIQIECDVALNGKEGLDLFESRGDIDYYDILWVDLKMPVMNGFDFTENVRKLGFKGVIIGFTGNISKESRQRCMSVGMDDVCAKPLSKSDIFALHWLECYNIPRFAY